MKPRVGRHLADATMPKQHGSEPSNGISIGRSAKPEEVANPIAFQAPSKIFRFGESASWAEAHMFWVKWLQRKRRRNRFAAVTIHYKLLSYEELKS